MAKTWEQMTADEKADELRYQLDNVVRQQNHINQNLATRLDALIKGAKATSGESGNPG